METFANFLQHQPLLALFLVIGVGYAIGEINIKGFSLGVGAVIFSGLAVGAISPQAQPPAIVGTLGLVMFLYGIGILYGKQFFSGLTNAVGIRYNLLGLITLLASAATAVVLMKITGISAGYAAGLFSGATTTVASMMAAVETVKNNEPAIGYSLVLPFALFGTMLCMYIMQLVVKPRIEGQNQNQLRTLEAKVEALGVVGTSLRELTENLPSGVSVLAIRSGGENKLPQPEHILTSNEILLLGSSDPSALDDACRIIGAHAPGQMVTDRSHLDYVRVFASKRQVIGIMLSNLKFPDGVGASIAQVRRGDVDLLATPDLVLEFGDRVGLLCERRHFEAIRKFFGDSIRGTTEFSYIALSIGMVLGVLVSIIPIPIPGLGVLKLGAAGGVLITALTLGRIGRTGQLTWTLPLSANIILRNLGVSLFLAQVGMSSGQQFVQTIAEKGVTLILLGGVIFLPLVLIPLLVGYYILRIPFDDLLGITSAMGANAALIAYASKALPSERVEVSYAMIYPGAIIVKIVIAQAMVAMAMP